MKCALRFLFLSLLAASLFVPGCRRSRSAPAAGANLLVITLDTTRADHLGCYGDVRAVTPTLDALAGAGVLFENCYTPVPLTLPAHCSLFTGRWPLAHGVRNNGTYALPAGAATLAEALQAAGYDTAALVAAYVLKGKYGLDQGFAWYEDRLGAAEKPGDADAEIAADRVYAKFRDWLLRPRRRPFFLWVHLYDPHKPYAPPPEFLKAAGGDPYRGEVACADHAVGRMIADLRARGLLERTLVVAAGDHGEGFGEHGERGHGVFCYEESVRVPLLFSGAGLRRRGARVSQRARLVDVMPTLLELLGVPLPASCQGASLAGLLSGKGEKRPRPVFLESLYGRELNNWAPLTGLISGRLKYISLPQAELYDLASDPGERDNLFLRRNAEARRLDGELAAFVAAQRGGVAAAGRSLDAGERKKLEALGYVSGFAAAGQAGLDPKDGIVLQERCAELVAALDRGETARVEAEALRLLEETAELKFPFAYLLLHYVYERQQRWDRAEANLRRAVAAFAGNPAQNAVFQGNLAELHLARGDVKAAEDVAATMLAADPRQPRVLELLGRAAAARSDWQRAMEFYLRAQREERSNYSLGKKVLQARLKLDDRRGALEALEPLLAAPEGRDDTDLIFTGAMLFVEAGDDARAEALLARLVAIEPTAPRWFDYALLLARSGRIERAIAGMEKALAAPAGQLDEERRQAARRALRAWKAERRR
jgi:arylsulfatase A-like enzyme